MQEELLHGTAESVQRCQTISVSTIKSLSRIIENYEEKLIELP